MTARLKIHIQNVLGKDCMGEGCKECLLSMGRSVGRMESLGDDAAVPDKNRPYQGTITDLAATPLCEVQAPVHEGGVGGHIGHGKSIEDAQK